MLDRAVLYDVLLCRRRKHNEGTLEQRSGSQEIRSCTGPRQWERITEVSLIQGFVSSFGFQQWLFLNVLQELVDSGESCCINFQAALRFG